MSMEALLLATRNHLRTQLSLTPTIQCEVTFQGMPLPFAGDTFYGVWDGAWTSQYDEGLEEIMGVNVTVTKRITGVPWDKVGPEVLAKASTGLLAACRNVMLKMHSNYTLMDAANTIIGLAASNNRFVRPLFFRGGDATQKVGAQWFFAAGNEQSAGLSKTMRFGDATRVQTIESMT